MKSDPDLDSDVIVVTESAPVSDQQLACVDVAASFYDVMLTSATQPRFNKIREARSAAFAVSEARKWLKAHNLLDRLPKYEHGISDDVSFSRKVERLCHAEGALRSRYGPHSLNPDWLLRRTVNERQDDKPIACLMNVTWATGFQLGFIGNEAVTQE